jgi:hypothetical protein
MREFVGRYAGNLSQDPGVAGADWDLGSSDSAWQIHPKQAPRESVTSCSASVAFCVLESQVAGEVMSVTRALEPS